LPPPLLLLKDKADVATDARVEFYSYKNKNRGSLSFGVKKLKMQKLKLQKLKLQK
jgi:hypothetical protein